MNLKELFEKSKEVIVGFEPLLRDFRLEEAEVKDGDYYVVVSYLIEDQNKPVAFGGLSMLQNQRSYERVFKRLIFNKELVFKKLLIFNK